MTKGRRDIADLLAEISREVVEVWGRIEAAWKRYPKTADGQFANVEAARLFLNETAVDYARMRQLQESQASLCQDALVLINDQKPRPPGEPRPPGKPRPPSWSVCVRKVPVGCRTALPKPGTTQSPASR